MRLLLAVPDPAVEAALLGRFARADAGTLVVRRCVDLADLLAAAASGIAADAAVVSSALRHLDRDAVAALHARGLRVVVVDEEAGEESDGASRRRGADVVSEPDPDAVLRALRAAGSTAVAGPPPRTEPADTVAGGRVVAVWGPVGAPGRTTVATTVADEAARLSVPTLLADADTVGPSVALRLGLLDDLSGLAAACRTAATGRLHRAELASSAVSLDSGLRVLTGLPRPERWTEIRPAALDEVWAVAREIAALTVVDCSFGLERGLEAQLDPTLPVRDGATLATLAAADTVLAVGRLDPVGLVRLLRGLPTVQDVAPTAELVAVLVGAAGRKGSAGDAADACRLLADRVGVTDVVVVPDDHHGVESAAWAGQTLAEAVPSSLARAALADLAARLAGVVPRRARRRRVRRSA